MHVQQNEHKRNIKAIRNAFEERRRGSIGVGSTTIAINTKMPKR
jgi:hypothetical protein